MNRKTITVAGESLEGIETEASEANPHTRLDDAAHQLMRQLFLRIGVAYREHG